MSPPQPVLWQYQHCCPDDVIHGITYLLSGKHKWPLANPQYPCVWAEGILQRIEISNEDFPHLHDSHDLDMFVALAPGFEWIHLSVSPGDDQAQVLETESGQFPLHARPSVGDHILAAGRWVFDCGHSPKTEVHPTPIFVSDRVEFRPLTPEGPPQLVHVARVWMNSDPGYFSFQLPASFTFTLPVPSTGVIPYLEVYSGAAENVSVVYAAPVGSFDDGKAVVTITAPDTVGKYYFELVLGCLADEKAFFNNAPPAYTVTLDQIQVVNAHPGGWYLDANVCGRFGVNSANGSWLTLFSGEHVSENVYPLAVSVPVVGDSLSIQVTGYHNVDPLAGELTTGGPGINNTPSLSLNDVVGKQFAVGVGDNTDWVLTCTVSAGSQLPTVLDDLGYWQPRLADKQSLEFIGYGLSGIGTKLGTLQVPPSGSPPLTTEHASYLLEAPLAHGSIRLLDSARDLYEFRLDDFATVEFGPLPSNLTLDTTALKLLGSNVPQNIKDMLGPKGYVLSVHSTSGNVGEQPYQLSVSYAWRELPPDWGTAFDSIDEGGKGGRLVDLVTPSPHASMSKSSMGTQSRQLEMDWAWQHVNDEVHWYDVWFPPATPAPAGQPSCTYDHDSWLDVRAGGMHLFVLETNTEANDGLSLGNLSTKIPDGHAHVRVTNPTGRRGVYQFWVEWTDSLHLDPVMCAAYGLFQNMRTFYPKPRYDPTINWAQRTPVDGGYLPWQQELPFSDLGSRLLIEGPEGDVIVSGPPDMPLVARIYDANNVLLTESTPVSASVLQRARVPGDLAPHAQLALPSTTDGTPLVMHISPAFPLGPGEVQSVPVALSRAI